MYDLGDKSKKQQGKQLDIIDLLNSGWGVGLEADSMRLNRMQKTIGVYKQALHERPEQPQQGAEKIGWLEGMARTFGATQTALHGDVGRAMNHFAYGLGEMGAFLYGGLSSLASIFGEESVFDTFVKNQAAVLESLAPLTNEWGLGTDYDASKGVDLTDPKFWSMAAGEIMEELPSMAIDLLTGGAIVKGGFKAATALWAYNVLEEAGQEAAYTYNDARNQGLTEDEAMDAATLNFIDNAMISNMDVVEGVMAMTPVGRWGEKLMRKGSKIWRKVGQAIPDKAKKWGEWGLKFSVLGASNALEEVAQGASSERSIRYAKGEK
ncbi:MAG: hypothetical protein D6790_21835, partial [Caldilineae bacterium]